MSKLPELHSKNIDNLKVYDGQWNDSDITDSQLKKLYESSFDHRSSFRVIPTVRPKRDYAINDHRHSCCNY